MTCCPRRPFRLTIANRSGRGRLRRPTLSPPLLQVKQTYQAIERNCAAGRLRKAVADTTIVAPFDGVVVEKHVALGEQVTGGFIASKVITIVRTGPLRISLTVPQQHIGAIKPGQTVSFQADSFPEKTFDGEVRYISPSVTSDTRSLVVEAVTPNPDGHIAAGTLRDRRDGTARRTIGVFRARRGGAEDWANRRGSSWSATAAFASRWWRWGKRTRRRVEITSGLQGTERIVRNPEQVREGAQVRK